MPENYTLSRALEQGTLVSAPILNFKVMNELCIEALAFLPLLHILLAPLSHHCIAQWPFIHSLSHFPFCWVSFPPRIPENEMAFLLLMLHCIEGRKVDGDGERRMPITTK